MVGWADHAVVALLVGLVALAGADCSSDPRGSGSGSVSCTGFGWTGAPAPACTFSATCPGGKYSLECSADTGACACKHDDDGGMVVEYQAPFCEAKSPLDAFAAANTACRWNLPAR